MAKFVYKYQSIEEIKERIKKNSEKEYASIQKLVQVKKNEINKVLETLNQPVVQKEKCSAQEMIFAEKYRESLFDKLKIKKIELEDLEHESEKILKKLIKHHKDHKVFEKLKDKQLEEFIKDQTKSELKSLDELANQKFNRREK